MAAPESSLLLNPNCSCKSPELQLGDGNWNVLPAPGLLLLVGPGCSLTGPVSPAPAYILVVILDIHTHTCRIYCSVHRHFLVGPPIAAHPLFESIDSMLLGNKGFYTVSWLSSICLLKVLGEYVQLLR